MYQNAFMRHLRNSVCVYTFTNRIIVDIVTEGRCFLVEYSRRYKKFVIRPNSYWELLVFN